MDIVNHLNEKYMESAYGFAFIAVYMVENTEDDPCDFGELYSVGGGGYGAHYVVHRFLNNTEAALFVLKGYGNVISQVEARNRYEDYLRHDPTVAFSLWLQGALL